MNRLDEQLSHARYLLNRIEAAYQYLPLCSHDWADIKQDILIRVWRKSKLIKDAPTWRGYVNTLVRNTFRNEIRDRCAAKRKWQYHMKPLMTRVVQDGCGTEEIRYEPDLPAPDHATLDHLREIIPTLTSKEQHTVTLFVEGKKITGKINTPRYQRNRKRRLRLFRSIRDKILNPL